MDYKQALEYLYNSTPVFEHVGAAAYKEGLQNTYALDDYFYNPHKNFKTIHVAGTNGKGSVSHTLAAVLQQHGYKVGLYTSPHIVDFAERIKVDGKNMSESFVIDFVENNKSFFEKIHPSLFELTTSMAFKYFADMNVDIAVIEVGLGGRLDCTNIISPELCVITNISFDHTGILGNTLQDIAREKAGIMKNSVPCVIGEYSCDTIDIFQKEAKEKGAFVIIADKVANETYIPEYQLKGYYQKRNALTSAVACTELSRLGILPSIDSVEYRSLMDYAYAHVIDLTHIRGRWEKIKDHPKVICDTGHNLAGWRYLAEQIRNEDASAKRVVFGMVNDKDIEGVLKLLPSDAIYYFCQASTNRAISSNEIRNKASLYKLKGKEYPSVLTAYNAALYESSYNDLIFIGGSSYVVSDLLSAIENQ